MIIVVDIHLVTSVGEANVAVRPVFSMYTKTGGEKRWLLRSKHIKG